MKKLLVAVILSLIFISLGVLTRTSWHVADNVEFVTALGLTSAFFLPQRWLAFFIPLLTMVISDGILGNDSIVWFTWSAYLVLPVLGIALKGLKLKDWTQNLIGIQLSGILFTVLFFLWSNLGVVVTSGMYSKDFTGLQESYINALPFLQNQLMGNLLIVPLVFLTAAMMTKLARISVFYNARDLHKNS